MRGTAILLLAVAATGAAACQPGTTTGNVLANTSDRAQEILENAGQEVNAFAHSAGNRIEDAAEAGLNKLRAVGNDIADGPDGNRSAPAANQSADGTRR